MINSIPLPIKQLSETLFNCISEKIAQNGPISFSDYMQLALYHPEWGYYNNGAQKFGQEGDFITAPDISPLFGRCLANQVAPILAELGQADILEFGAGAGQLAVDILQALAKVDQLPEHYYILELSAELKQRQRKKILEQIPELQNKVIWLEQLPQNFQGVVVANEVLDAMPIHRFCSKENSLWECRVDCEAGELREKWILANGELANALVKLQMGWPEHYCSEINLWLPAWLASLSHCFKRGLVLLVDYGFPRQEYYHPDRSMGTLMCHYQHRAHADPYFYPGLQDITAHVDFTAVAEAAIAAGFELAGYTTQAHFLLGCGLAEFSMGQDISVQEHWKTSQAVKKLVLPSEMGELFKVMALSKGISSSLQGFMLKDLRGKL